MLINLINTDTLTMNELGNWAGIFLAIAGVILTWIDQNRRRIKDKIATEVKIAEIIKDVEFQKKNLNDHIDKEEKIKQQLIDHTTNIYNTLRAEIKDRFDDFQKQLDLICKLIESKHQ